MHSTYGTGLAETIPQRAANAAVVLEAKRILSDIYVYIYIEVYSVPNATTDFNKHEKRDSPQNPSSFNGGSRDNYNCFDSISP